MSGGARESLADCDVFTFSRKARGGRGRAHRPLPALTDRNVIAIRQNHLTLTGEIRHELRFKYLCLLCHLITNKIYTDHMLCIFDVKDIKLVFVYLFFDHDLCFNTIFRVEKDIIPFIICNKN